MFYSHCNTSCLTYASGVSGSNHAETMLKWFLGKSLLAKRERWLGTKFGDFLIKANEENAIMSPELSIKKKTF